MNKYRVYYKSLYKKSDWPSIIESDSYHVHTVRDPGYMTDTVSFYKKADQDSFSKDKILIATIQHVEHVVLMEETVSNVPSPLGSDNKPEPKKKRGWFFGT